MTLIKTQYNRRSFLKRSVVAGGGSALGFSWFASCKPTEEEVLAMSEEWFDINAYLKIGDNGVVTIYTPNPEFGQNIMTSMPMIVAEELDVDWKNVISEQAPFNAEKYGFQFTGGSRGIMSRWEGLRMAGASARHMLKEAAAQAWEVPVSEITTKSGMLLHEASGKSAGYGEMASAATNIPIPEEVELKEVKDFGFYTGFGDEWLRIGPIKTFMDGSFTMRKAAIYPPAVDDSLGTLVWEKDELIETVKELHQMGWQICAHAQGDRGIDLLLDAYEAALDEFPRENHRHRVEHSGITTPSIQKRYKDLGIVVASQPNLIHFYGSNFPFYGPERMRWIYAAGLAGAPLLLQKLDLK